MLVQRIITKNNQYRYIVLDDEGRVIEPIKRFLKHLDHTRRKENTLKSYATHLKYFFLYLKEKQMDYREAADDHGGIEIISDYMQWLQYPEQDGVIYARGEGIPPYRSAKTVNIMIGTVLAFYDYMARLGEVPELDVAKEMKISSFKGVLAEMHTKKGIKSHIFRMKEKKNPVEIISREEIQRLLSACNSLRDKLLLLWMFEAGLRLGEILGLFLEDVCVWENKIKIVSREHKENGARVKNEAEGELLVPEYTMKLFCKYVADEYRNLDSNYVFVNLKGKNRGKAMKPITVQKLFERLSKDTGIHVHPHMLRHSHATELIETGKWDALLVKDRMRHRQIQTTINTYVHLSDQYKKQQFQEYQKKVERRGQDEKNRTDL